MLRLLILPFLGLLTSVAIAWACAIVPVGKASARTFAAPFAGRFWQVHAAENFGRSWLCPSQLEFVPQERFSPDTGELLLGSQPIHRLPSWANTPIAVKPTRGLVYPAIPSAGCWFEVGRYGAGWPMRCLWGASETWSWECSNYLTKPSSLPPPPPPYPSGSFPAQPGLLRLRDTQDPFDGIVPFYPIYLGLAANTAFYAAAWWLLFLGPRGLRRHLRRRRGQCLPCGYDLRGAIAPQCPECGAADSNRVRSIPA